MSTEFANESHASSSFHQSLSYCGMQGIVRRLPRKGYHASIAGMATVDLNRLELELRDRIDGMSQSISGVVVQDCYDKLVRYSPKFEFIPEGQMSL